MIDSGVTDHYFIDCADFVEYKKFQISLISRTAENGTDFEIVGQETIRLVVEVTDERIIDLTLYNILHMPSLYSNLILISKICSLGLTITFSKNNIMASFSYGRIMICVVWYRELYHIKMVRELKVFMVSSVQKLCFIDG